jgi:hypothetical protein
MSAGDLPRWFRTAFGRPRIVHSVLWGILGMGAIALCLDYAHRGVPTWWVMILVAAWAWGVAALYLVVALRDRRRGTGAYAAPATHRMSED